MIYGERVRFRGAERSDLPTFVKWINDPEVTAGLNMTHPFSQAEEDDWFEKMLLRPIDERVLVIEVKELREDGEENWVMIGTCGFAPIDWRNRSAEFGISIGDKRYWNQGFGTEAVRLLCKHGFETLNMNRIFLRVLDTNPRAIRAYEKAGFTHEVRLRQAEFRNGNYCDIHVMSILKDEF